MQISRAASLLLAGLQLTSLPLVHATTMYEVHGKPYNIHQVIDRDICVIGGGASGTYAAIRARDFNKTVVVIEREDRLGGHTQTYRDPITGGTIDIGVIIFNNLTVVLNFFARFNISLVKSSTGPGGAYADFRTGEIDAGYEPPTAEAALAGYAAQLEKYPYLDDGFSLPDPVPEDLLLPFGEFVTKYSLESLVSLWFAYDQGVGDILNSPTLYVLKIMNLDVVKAINEENFLTTAASDNSLLYEAAQASLGADVLLNSTVVAMDRSATGANETANIVVQTPAGQIITQCQKIVSSIPPKLDNLAGYDLNDDERRLFGQFINTAYYTGIIRNSGIPDNTSITNFAPELLYNLPPLPVVYAFSQTGVPDLLDVKYGSIPVLPDDQVKADIFATLKRIQVPGKNDSAIPELVTFSGHSPFELTVPVDVIRNGFYTEVNALQGQRRTFYTGAAFQTQSSSLLWKFTEALLPQIVA